VDADASMSFTRCFGGSPVYPSDDRPGKRSCVHTIDDSARAYEALCTTRLLQFFVVVSVASGVDVFRVNREYNTFAADLMLNELTLTRATFAALKRLYGHACDTVEIDFVVLVQSSCRLRRVDDKDYVLTLPVSESTLAAAGLRLPASTDASGRDVTDLLDLDPPRYRALASEIEDSEFDVSETANGGSLYIQAEFTKSNAGPGVPLTVT
jgi:hypothetical protein